MGIINSLLGSASEVNVQTIQTELSEFLLPKENVQKAYSVFRDLLVFTDLRLILVDKQGATGKKINYRSIPYRNISSFSIETAGAMDLDAELCIWVIGADEPIVKKFNRKLSISELQNTLARFVLRS